MAELEVLQEMDSKGPSAGTLAPTFVIELPPELQYTIFEFAARLNRQCACKLLLVAKHVKKWILPILCEDVILKNKADASRFILVKRKYLLEQSVPKYLTLGPTISSHLVQELIHLSRSLITLTILRNGDDGANVFFRCIESPIIRQLALISDRNWGQVLEVPYNLLPSITHLAIISRYDLGTSFNFCMKVAEALQTDDEQTLAALNVPKTALNPFINLTRLAISVTDAYDPNPRIKNYMPRLKCFAILPSQYIPRLLAKIRLQEDPRLVVITRSVRSEYDWSRIEDFWTTIENLVRTKCICDNGEKWGEKIVKRFQLNNPHISLLT